MNTTQSAAGALDALQPEYARVNRAQWFTQWYDRNALNLQWLRHAASREGRQLRVLELGIGWGGASLCLAREGALVIGVDDFSDGLDVQGVPQMRFLEAQRVRVVRGNLLALPVRRASFDVVILNDVLEHMSVPKRVLRMINGLLKPGGLFIMEVPNSVALYKRLRVLCGRSNYYRIEHFFLDEEYRGHVREYTKTEIAYMFEQTGFTALEIRGVNQAYRPWFESRTPSAAARPLLRLYSALTGLRDTWKDHYCCLARKDESVAESPGAFYAA
jgi:2-polyprenyl-3-methyl-5-hydroxy-6-metoxy-1,4-benzoquinol methylase